MPINVIDTVKAKNGAFPSVVDAEDSGIVDAGGYFTSENVEGALQEIGGAGYLTEVAFADLTDYPADAAGVLTNDGAGNLSWGAGGGMVYPGAGIAVSTGSAWDTSITDNSSNWDTAYGWGNHADAGYITDLSGFTTDDLTEGTTNLYDQTVAFTDGEGIDTSGTYPNFTIAGEDATTTNKGIASFNTDDFTVTSGAVSIKDGGVAHNSLYGLQGGTTNEYYHLTSAQHTELTEWMGVAILSDDGSLYLEGGEFEAGVIFSDGNVYVNYDGSDGDSYLYFYDGGSASGRFLQWDDVHTIMGSGFVFSGNVAVNGLYNQGNHYLRYIGGEGDSAVYFFDGGVTKGQYVMWDDSESKLALSTNVYTNGTNFYLNYGGPDGDSILYFYDGTAPTGALIMWDDSESIFNINKDWSIGNADIDHYLYFFDSSNPKAQYVRWADRNKRIETSTDTYINGALIVNRSTTTAGLQVNTAAADINVNIDLDAAFNGYALNVLNTTNTAGYHGGYIKATNVAATTDALAVYQGSHLALQIKGDASAAGDVYVDGTTLWVDSSANKIYMGTTGVSWPYYNGVQLETFVDVSTTTGVSGLSFSGSCSATSSWQALIGGHLEAKAGGGTYYGNYGEVTLQDPDAGTASGQAIGFQGGAIFSNTAGSVNGYGVQGALSWDASSISGAAACFETAIFSGGNGTKATVWGYYDPDITGSLTGTWYHEASAYYRDKIKLNSYIATDGDKRSSYIIPVNVTTTNNSATTIATLQLLANSSLGVIADVNCYNASYRAKYQKVALFYRTTGNASQQGSTVDGHSDIESDANLNCTISASGQTAIVQVTGITGQTINWVGHITVLMSGV